MNFEFIREIKEFKALYQFCRDAEQLATQRPYLSGIAARNALEYIVKFEDAFTDDENKTPDFSGAELGGDVFKNRNVINIGTIDVMLNDLMKNGLKINGGDKIGKTIIFATSHYEADVAESHHIDYYVRSMNNDANNQIIVCPNHHSIIHAAEPDFRRDSLSFMYPNGFVESLAINLHLR